MGIANEEPTAWLKGQGFTLDVANGTSFTRILPGNKAQVLVAVTRGPAQPWYWTAAMVEGGGNYTPAVRYVDQQTDPVAAFVLAETRQWQI